MFYCSLENTLEINKEDSSIIGVLHSDRKQIIQEFRDEKKPDIFLARHKDTVRVLKLCPTRKLIVSGGNDSQIKIWDLGLGKQTGEWIQESSENIVALDLHHSERWIFCGGYEHSIKILDISDPSKITVLNTLAFNNRVYTLNFLRKKNALLCGGYNKRFLRLWTNLMKNPTGRRLSSISEVSEDNTNKTPKKQYLVKSLINKMYNSHTPRANQNTAITSFKKNNKYSTQVKMPKHIFKKPLIFKSELIVDSHDNLVQSTESSISSMSANDFEPNEINFMSELKESLVDISRIDHSSEFKIDTSINFVCNAPKKSLFSNANPDFLPVPHNLELSELFTEVSQKIKKMEKKNISRDLKLLLEPVKRSKNMMITSAKFKSDKDSIKASELGNSYLGGQKRTYERERLYRSQREIFKRGIGGITSRNRERNNTTFGRSQFRNQKPRDLNEQFRSINRNKFKSNRFISEDSSQLKSKNQTDWEIAIDQTKAIGGLLREGNIAEKDFLKCIKKETKEIREGFERKEDLNINQLKKKIRFVDNAIAERLIEVGFTQIDCSKQMREHQNTIKSRMLLN